MDSRIGWAVRWAAGNGSRTSPWRVSRYPLTMPYQHVLEGRSQAVSSKSARPALRSAQAGPSQHPGQPPRARLSTQDRGQADWAVLWRPRCPRADRQPQGQRRSTPLTTCAQYRHPALSLFAQRRDRRTHEARRTSRPSRQGTAPPPKRRISSAWGSPGAVSQPCTVGQPISRNSRACGSVSTPSATTRRPNVVARSRLPRQSRPSRWSGRVSGIDPGSEAEWPSKNSHLITCPMFVVLFDRGHRRRGLGRGGP